MTGKSKKPKGTPSRCLECGYEWDWTGTKERKCPDCGKRNTVDVVITEDDPPQQPTIETGPKVEETLPTIKVDKTVMEFTHNVLHTGSVLASKVVGEWIIFSERDHKDLDEPTAKIMGKFLVQLSKYNDWVMFIYALGVVTSRKIESKTAFDKGVVTAKSNDLDNYLKGIQK